MNLNFLLDTLKQFGLTDTQIKNLLSAVESVIAKCPVTEFPASDIHKLKTFSPFDPGVIEPISDEALQLLKEGSYTPFLLMSLPSEEIYILDGGNLLKSAADLGGPLKVKIITYQDIENLKLGIYPIFNEKTADLIKNSLDK